MIDAIVWYLWMQVFGIAGWLLSRRLLGGLPDRGYGASKTLGLILGGFAYWILVTLGLAANNTGAVLLALIAVAVAALGLAIRRGGSLAQTPIRISLRSIPSYIWWTEGAFLAAFALCALFRAYVPDINEAGGEKYMESMFINAILRSPTFPPNDAWLSGLPISYYYFGYVLLAMLTRVSGIAPAIAFNLGGAMFFALAVVTAFSAGYNLFGLRVRAEAAAEPDGPSRGDPRPLAAGLLTAVMLTLMGNLGGFLGVLRCNNTLPDSFWRWLDVRQIATRPIDYCQNGEPRGFFYSWWWDWSRVVKDLAPGSTTAAPQQQEVITEVPIFSYILGDNHPHVMGLPFNLLALIVALAFLTQPVIRETAELSFAEMGSKWPPWIRRQTIELPIGVLPELALAAILAGGLSFMNTWDFPVFGGLIALALIAGRALRRESLMPAILFSMAVFIVGYVIYLPFYATFSSQAKGVMINLFNGTKFHQYFLIFAPFLIAAIGLIALLAREWEVGPRALALKTARLAATGLVAALLLAALFGLLSPTARALATELSTTGKALGVSSAVVGQRLTERINPFDPSAAGPWTPLILITGAALCAVIAWQALGPRVRPASEGIGAEDVAATLAPALIAPGLFALTLLMLGALITASVEFVFLLDNFGTRMNTVFKFYFQGWTMWSVAGGFAIVALLGDRKVFSKVIGIVALVFVGLGLMWPVFASASRTDGFSRTPTLDGAAYLKQYHPDDARLIDWINLNVTGAPVIVEAPGKGFASYVYSGRISAFTGLPTLLGWGGHENQWRGNYTVPGLREPQIERLYSITNDDTETRRILRQFDVTYVVVGEAERQVYKPEGLAKFDRLCAAAFRSGNSTLYACK